MNELLDYNPATGSLTWKERSGSRGAGAAAGTPHKSGYVTVQVRGKKYLAHRLAWFLHYGEWPQHEIDLINGVLTDIRLCNLRQATREQNSYNSGKRKNNTSGYKGVAPAPNGSAKWRAQIHLGGKQISLGTFDTPEAAHAAYCEFARTHHKEFFHG